MKESRNLQYYRSAFDKTGIYFRTRELMAYRMVAPLFNKLSPVKSPVNHKLIDLRF
jgi:hypothetical protein